MLQVPDVVSWLTHRHRPELWLASGSSKTAEFPEILAWVKSLVAPATPDAPVIEVDLDGQRWRVEKRDPIDALSRRRGGKLLHYNGWSDPGISPRSSVEYYAHIRDSMGGDTKTQEAYRLFMVPAWVIASAAMGRTRSIRLTPSSIGSKRAKHPDRIIAAHWTAGKIDRTRPLCPYPQVTEFKGTGSVDEAVNFICKQQ